MTRRSSPPEWVPVACRSPGGHRWLGSLPGDLGRGMAVCSPLVVCLPRPEGPAQAGPGRRAAVAPGAGPARQPGPQAPAWSTPQSPSHAAWADAPGEVRLRLQAPLFDREAAGSDEPAGADGSGDDAELSARVEGIAGPCGPPATAVRGGSRRARARRWPGDGVRRWPRITPSRWCPSW